MRNTEQTKCPIFGDIFFNRESSLKEGTFKGIMEGFMKGIDCKTNVYEKGDIIARQGDTCKGLYLLTKGSVKTEMINENGGVLSIEKIDAIKPLAPAFIFAKINIFPVDVIATEKSEILFITKEDILTLFQRDTNFMEKYIQYNANKTQFLSDKLQVLTIKTIRGKLAHYIMGIYLAQHHNSRHSNSQLSNSQLNNSQLNNTRHINSQQIYFQEGSSQNNNPQKANPQKTNIITLDKNQTELAKFFGVTRPSLARILHEMEEEGLISINRKEIQILDLNGLKEARG